MAIIKGTSTSDQTDKAFVWCWTGRTTEYVTGEISIRTTQVTSLYELGKRIWLDGWIPTGEITWMRKGDVYRGDVKDIMTELLPAIENALRFKYKGDRQVPDGSFLEVGTIPTDYILAGDERLGKLEVKREIEVLDIVDTTVLGTKKIMIDEEQINERKGTWANG